MQGRPVSRATGMPGRRSVNAPRRKTATAISLWTMRDLKYQIDETAGIEEADRTDRCRFSAKWKKKKIVYNNIIAVSIAYRITGLCGQSKFKCEYPVQ